MKQNRQKKYQRILAIVLCVLMVLGLFAGVLPAFAETAPQDMTAQKAAEQCTADGLSRYFDYIPKEGTALTFEELGNLYTSKTVPDMEQLMREAKKSNTPPKYLTEICKPNEGRMVLVYEDGSPAGLLMMQRDDAGVWRAIGSDADAAGYLDQVLEYGVVSPAAYVGTEKGVAIGYLFDDTGAGHTPNSHVRSMLGYKSKTKVDEASLLKEYYTRWSSAIQYNSVDNFSSNYQITLLPHATPADVNATARRTVWIGMIVSVIILILFGCIAWALVRAWKQKGTEREKWMDKVPLAHLCMPNRFFNTRK